MKAESITPFYVIGDHSNIEVLEKWRVGHLNFIDSIIKTMINDGVIIGLSLNPYDGLLHKGFNPLKDIKGKNYDFGKEITFEEFCKRENIENAIINQYKGASLLSEIW